jgi:hypothetical protein
VKCSGECSSEVDCASVLVKNSYECSSELLCASVLVKYFVPVLCTSGRCCGDWGIMSIIYRIYTTGSVWKPENTAVGICHADHVAPSIRKSWQSLRRQAAVAR